MVDNYGSDIAEFKVHKINVDDILTSVPLAEDAVSLLKTTQQHWKKNTIFISIRLHQTTLKFWTHL